MSQIKKFEGTISNSQHELFWSKPSICQCERLITVCRVWLSLVKHYFIIAKNRTREQTESTPRVSQDRPYNLWAKRLGYSQHEFKKYFVYFEFLISGNGFWFVFIKKSVCFFFKLRNSISLYLYTSSTTKLKETIFFFELFVLIDITNLFTYIYTWK